MAESEPWHKRLAKKGISESGSQVFWALASSIWIWIGGPTLIALILGHWTETPADVKFVLAFASVALGALLWNAFGRKSEGAAQMSGKAQILPAPIAAKSSPYVEFTIPSNWGDGLFFGKKEPDPRVGEFMSEELRVHVIAKQLMKNVRFELTIKSRDRSTNQLETLAQVGSGKFAGTVPNGVEQSFVILRRRFWHVMSHYDNAITGEQGHQQVRVEQNIMMLPDCPEAFEGVLGKQYFVSISVAHDEDAPEVGVFSVSFADYPLGFPRSSLTSKKNIEVVRP